jgi:hypothetical protein
MSFCQFDYLYIIEPQSLPRVLVVFDAAAVLLVGAGRYPHHLELRAHSNRHKTTESDTSIGKEGVKGWHADWGIGQW